MKTLRFIVGLLAVSFSAVLISSAHAAIPSETVTLGATTGGGNENTNSTASPSASATSENSGGYTGGANDGTTGPAGISVPRLMLQSLVTNPTSITAGESFTVSFTLMNTSKKTRVNNIKVSLTSNDGAFLPDSGASSLYIPTIRAEGTASRDLTFRSLPSLENRPYAMNLRVEYEDTESNAFTTEETVAVNVVQPSRADTSTFTVSPEVVTLGQEATVTFSLNNMGKTKIFNAAVSIADGQGVMPKTQFIGAIDAGASGNVELSLIGVEERYDPIQAVITYEDASGNVTTLEKELTMAIMPPVEEMPGTEDPFPTEKEEDKGFQIEAWMYWAAGGTLLALVLAIVVIRVVRNRRASKEQASDMDLLDDEPLAGPMV